VAHRGQSRALLLRRRGRIQSYTPSAYSSQNTTLSHAASTDRKQTGNCQLTNLNLCDMFHALRNTPFTNLYFNFTKFGTLTILFQMFQRFSFLFIRQSALYVLYLLLLHSRCIVFQIFNPNGKERKMELNKGYSFRMSGMKRARFTLIELLVVIAIAAILSRSKNSFFLLFSAI